MHIDTYQDALRMESELLQMTGQLLSKNPALGVITSGGSESLIMALKAYKCYYSSRTKPNMYISEHI